MDAWVQVRVSRRRCVRGGQDVLDEGRDPGANRGPDQSAFVQVGVPGG